MKDSLEQSNSGSLEVTQCINVAVIEPVGGAGGMDFYNHQLCESLTAAGCKVILFTSSGYRSKSPAVGYRIVESFAGVFGEGAKWRRAIRFVIAICKSLFYARLHRVRLVHFHIFHVGLLQYMNVLLARMMGFRVIVTAHDVGSFRAGESAGLLRGLYAHCSAVIAHSKTAQNALIQHVGLKPQAVHVIPHGNYAGLLPAFPKKFVARDQLGIGHNDVVVLFFGQCKKIKRLDLLVDAIARARRLNIDRLKLVIAGPILDVDSRELTNQIQQLLGDSVIHHSHYIANEDLPIYFAAADVVALPYDRIFQSGVVLLAMTYGLPVLASDIEGMTEIVKNRKNGLTFCAGNVEDLAQRLVEIEQGKWPLTEYARVAQSYVLTHHSWGRCGKITASVYSRVANEKKLN